MTRRKRGAGLLIAMLILQFALLCLACTVAGTHMDCCETCCALCGFIALVRGGEMFLPFPAIAALFALLLAHPAGLSLPGFPELDTLIARKVQLND